MPFTANSEPVSPDEPTEEPSAEECCGKCKCEKPGKPNDE